MAVGLLVGAAASVGAGQLVATLLYGVGAHDGPTFLLAVGTLAVIGSLAVLIPALRVTRIDPVDALRA
jgi:ABC-type antimicrobial peptide transport system permease subunit